MTNSRRRGSGGTERGQAGAEMWSLGILVFVIGTLIFVWGSSYLATRADADAIATQFIRVYSEGTDAASARRDALVAAESLASARGVTWSRVRIETTGAFGRCLPVDVNVRIRVNGISLPGIQGLTASEVSVTHREFTDPYHAPYSDLPNQPATVCDETE